MAFLTFYAEGRFFIATGGDAQLVERRVAFADESSRVTPDGFPGYLTGGSPRDRYHDRQGTRRGLGRSRRDALRRFQRAEGSSLELPYGGVAPCVA